MSTRQIRCPSCDGPMNPVERRGVVIDICRDCKGVFLDRGELDKLLDAAEGQEVAYASEGGRPGRRPDRDRYDDDDDDDDDDRSPWGQQRGGRKKKRGGFLSELFEGD